MAIFVAFYFDRDKRRQLTMAAAAVVSSLIV